MNKFKINTLLISVLCAFSFHSYASALRCEQVFEKNLLLNKELDQNTKNVKINFDPLIKKEKQVLITQAIESTLPFIKNLKLPEKVVIKVDTGSTPEIAKANMFSNEIFLHLESIEFSPESVSAIVSHEFTHLIIGRNMIVTDKQQTLLDLNNSKNNRDADLLPFMAISHRPYAEVICDLMSALTSGNLKIIPKIQSEIIDLASRNA